MDLWRLSINQIKKLIKSGQVSPEEVYKVFLSRIKKFNPGLNAFITVIEKPEIDKTKKDAPLFGIPFSMKDVYMTKGIKTTAGSAILKNYISQYDAAVYRRLKQAGAVLIGKTNCDAWGHGVSTENSDLMTTKNPWNTDFVAGGSSGGSGACLAKDMAVFDIGEDTGGSIRLPASFCSVVGLKATYGLISRYGAIAYASSLDTVGPMARTVEDCALVLEAIAGKDRLDATSSSLPIPKYSQQLNKSIKGTKIGIPKEYFVKGLDQEVAQKVKQVINRFEKMGARIIKISLPMTKYAIAVYYLIAPSETSSNLSRFDGIRYGKGRGKFGDEAKRRILLGTFALSAGYYDAYYLKATKIRTLIKRDFEKAFKTVDVIVAPVSPTPPFKIGEKADDPLQMYLADVFTVPISLAGVPSLSLPCGFSQKGLPIGFQIIGPHFQEAKILNFGHQYQKESGTFREYEN
ncbi:MAG: Asp-tRNA(Asn)/Glu-tRNA(Gln) amidotransferase subunit GatA [Patescibacteria group bacterium]|nr:Asp-tRNA(Asn)/Glu-tRNA(Gln) amidotransferase subunit GatA [Patescibacteria group bacterium]